MADWSTLPYDILHKISKYIIAIEDFLAFSAVCCSWRSVYSAKQWDQVPQVPLLMFCENESNSLRNFVSLCTNKVYKLYLPEARGRRCWGSSLGWLITVSYDHQIQLLNPFTRVSMDLPSKSPLNVQYGEILEWFGIIEKAFVFKKPCVNESSLLVMLIYGSLRRLAFCRPGYSSWYSVEDDLHSEFIDVSLVKDQIVALSIMGSLVFVNIHGPGVITTKCFHAPEPMALSFPQWDLEQFFLGELSDDILMVKVHRNGNRHGSSIESIESIVSSYDLHEKRWIRLSHLGDRAIFVDGNCCVCVHAPDRFNCKSNSVYFIRKERPWLHREILVDVGVYGLADGRCESLWCGDEIPTSYSFPIWALPTLY